MLCIIINGGPELYQCREDGTKLKYTICSNILLCIIINGGPCLSGFLITEAAKQGRTRPDTEPVAAGHCRKNLHRAEDGRIRWIGPATARYYRGPDAVVHGRMGPDRAG